MSPSGRVLIGLIGISESSVSLGDMSTAIKLSTKIMAMGSQHPLGGSTGQR